MYGPIRTYPEVVNKVFGDQKNQTGMEKNRGKYIPRTEVEMRDVTAERGVSRYGVKKGNGDGEQPGVYRVMGLRAAW